MIVPYVIFIRPIPVLGTHLRQDQFRADEGWLIDVHDYGVTLSKAEQQNVPEVPAFCTCGVGYSIPSPVDAGEKPALTAEELAALFGHGATEPPAVTFAEQTALGIKLGVPVDDSLTPEAVRRMVEGDREVIASVSKAPPAKGRRK